MNTYDLLRAPHAAPQPPVTPVEAQIQLAEMYRLKAIQDGRDDLRIHWENRVRELRQSGVTA